MKGTQNNKNLIKDILRKNLNEYSGSAEDYEELEPHVEQVLSKIKNAAGGGSAFKRLDRPEEKVEAIAQIGERVGIPRNEMWTILGNIRKMAREQDEEVKLEKYEELQKDVEFFVDRILNNVNVDQAMSKINKREEKEELVSKLIEMVGVPLHRMYDIMSAIMKQGDGDY